MAAPASATAVAPTTPTGAAATPATAQAAAATAQPGAAVAADAKPADATAAPADGAPAGKLQIPAELLTAKADAKGGHTKDFKNGDQPQRDLPPAPTLPPTADRSGRAGRRRPRRPRPSPIPAPRPRRRRPSRRRPSPPPTPQTAGAGLQWRDRRARHSPAPPSCQTAERVQELVRIATTRAGNARATLQLRPAELGQVDVHLRTTRNGLVATIAAHDQVGLDALQQAGNELRRSLEDKGVQLHSLDLQLGAGENGFSNQGDAREASSGRRGAAATHDLGSDDDVVTEDELTITYASVDDRRRARRRAGLTPQDREDGSSCQAPPASPTPTPTRRTTRPTRRPARRWTRTGS